MTLDRKSRSERIKQEARRLGFDLVGITPAEPHSDIAFFDQWIRKGYDGSMAYLQKRRDDRADPTRILAGAKSLICCGLNYYGGEELPVSDPERGLISRYAWGDDYHRVVFEKLQALEHFIRSEIDTAAQLKSYVDTGPILERSYAAWAGLGWIGKNTLLINRRIGSYFFIGEILTDLDLRIDSPAPDHCGQCRLCLEACPTQALTPYEMDATRCISYLTIELRGDIPKDLQEAMGQHLVGCDICQEVCPWNGDIPQSAEAAFKPRPALDHPLLDTLESLGIEGFRNRFKDSAIKRVKWEGLLRNITIARKNAGKLQTAS